MTRRKSNIFIRHKQNLQRKSTVREILKTSPLTPGSAKIKAAIKKRQSLLIRQDSLLNRGLTLGKIDKTLGKSVAY